ncbi:diguanylate cyclase [Cognatilysobacter lacus]|uniref:diguanylate cyclase n=1 Tax=Cognatilysobacter lacus TaxID=1643323 RepID=A0A5D8Z611_9GAMM|nr:diguanylate cyclase [Lysobacter lacus]TZF89956.1 GGDEF domain-containing protein [Lysobacter lacus]
MPVPRRLLHALFAAALLAAATAAPASGSAAGFDRVFLQIDDGEIAVDDDRQIADALRRLQSLLPAGDARRARRFQATRCGLQFRHDSKAALAFAARGLAESRKARDTEAQARFEYCRGYAYESSDNDAALAAYARGLRIAGGAEDARLMGDGYVLRGSIRSLQGRQALALGDFLTAQTIYDRAYLARRAETNLLNIGMAYRRMGVYAQALVYLRESEAYARALDSYPDLYSALVQEGYAFEEQNQADAALRVFGQALAIAQRSDAIDRGYARLGLANGWLAKGDGTRALEQVTQARRDLAIDHTADHEPMLDQVEARALAMQGQHRAAIAAFGRAEALMHEQDSARYLVLLHRARAASEEAVGDDGAALADLRAYVALDTRLQRESEGEQVTLWRMRFDTGRRDLERARLDIQRRGRDQQIRALQRERPWRWLALMLGTSLLTALGALAFAQWREGGRLRRLALSDALTGLANRRQILRLGQRAFRAAQHDGEPLSLVSLDLDHFKQVNDRHGHAVGDTVLARVADAFAGALRRQDHLGRSGGEEFVALLPGTGADEAAAIAERLRQAVAALSITPGLAVRTSAGVATSRDGDRRLNDLLARADAALYRAKAAGRDCVIAAD